MKRSALVDIDLEPIKRAFSPNDPMPDMPAGPVGRFRLVSALQKKYGQDFRMMKSARDALSHFDKETAMLKKFVEAKGRHEGNGG